MRIARYLSDYLYSLIFRGNGKVCFFDILRTWKLENKLENKKSVPCKNEINVAAVYASRPAVYASRPLCAVYERYFLLG